MLIVALLDGRALIACDSTVWSPGRQPAGAQPKAMLLPGPAVLAGRGNSTALHGAMTMAAVHGLRGDDLLRSLPGLVRDGLECHTSPLQAAAQGLELAAIAHSPGRGRMAAAVATADGDAHELAPGEVRMAPVPLAWRLDPSEVPPAPRTLAELDQFAARLHRDGKHDGALTGGALWLIEVSETAATLSRGTDLE